MTHNQQNISPRNAYARIMMGSVMTAYGTAQIIRDSKSRNGQMLVLLGSMKIAEGATKFCPIKAMGSSMTGSNKLQNMTSGNASQSTLAGVGAAMNNGTQATQSSSSGSTGQASGSIMQMVGNIAQKLTGGNASQSSMVGAQGTSGTQSMSGGSGQNAAGGNIAQTIGNVAQQMTTGTAAQTIAPQVGQIMNGVASMIGSQNASGTNNDGKQASATSGASNTNETTNGNANTKNATNGTSNGTKNATGNSGTTKSASVSNSSGNKQATSSTGNNTPKAGATKTLIDGAANNANLSYVAASVINASSKTTDKNTSSSNILQ
jgi:hypothetical protein